MDSLSQIVLGAAVGEATLGKKIGNRAMVAGAIGGTIPDLDVIANAFLTPMQALDFHRGISHSIVFSVIAPFLFGGFAYFLYRKNVHRNKWYRGLLSIPLILAVFFLAGAAGYAAVSIQNWWALAGSIAIGLLLAIPMIKYWLKQPDEFEISFWRWYLLFFLAFSTHLLLDCFTSYGTQIFMPFSNYRVAFSSVSVVDPLYTIPFLLFLLMAAMMKKDWTIRSITNWLGIIISTGYLLFGLYNKSVVNQVFAKSLKTHDIEYSRYFTSPTLFQTLLWSGTVESDTSYHIGVYSRMDPSSTIQRFVEIPKNHHLLAGHENDEHIQILKRFSNGYYTVSHSPDSTSLLFTDLRWGALDNIIQIPEEERFPMQFELIEQNGKLIVIEEEKDEDAEMFKDLTRLPTILAEMNEKHPNFLVEYWERIMGKRQ